MASDSSASGAEKKVFVATGNAGKVREIHDALSGLAWTFVGANDVDPAWPSPIEDGETFEDNARIKAVSAHRFTGGAALADDSGLEVDALDGAPGVYSSRFAGECATDADNNARLLLALKEVPDDERTARFRCAIVFIDEDGTETVSFGSCEGRIGHEPRGDNGFGYDPLFLPDATPGRSMAQLDVSEKRAISHRGAAIAELRSLLAR